MKRFCISVAALLGVLSVNAADKKTLMTYYSSLNGLKKEELKTTVWKLVNTTVNVLDYGSSATSSNSTWYGFYKTDRIGNLNIVVDRYSNDLFYFGDKGSSVSGMNIAHSFSEVMVGWTIVRFSEHQLFTEPLQRLRFVYDVAQKITPGKHGVH